MEQMLQDPVNAWLTAGALIIAFEAFTMPGIGLFLAGLGAICTALLIKSGLVSETATYAHFAWFFGFTTAWGALMWKPLRKFRMHRKARGVEVKTNNIIGETATVARGGLRYGDTGQVVWSGTVMSAQLEHEGELSEGAHVRIVSVSGTVLKVVPK